MRRQPSPDSGPGHPPPAPTPVPAPPGPLPILLVLASLLLTAQVRTPAAPAPPTAPAPPLAPALHALLQQPAFASATWGVRVEYADTGTVLFETNAHRLLKPASCAKLFTAALVLDTFPDGHRIHTDFIPATRLRADGSLRGDLILRGRGDFSLAPRFHGGQPDDSLRPVVDALKSAGLRRIRGALVVDDSHFSGAPFGGGWTWDDLQYGYGAEVGTLNLDDNLLPFSLRPGLKPGDPVEVILPAHASTPGTLAFHTRHLTTTQPGSPRRVIVRRDPGSREVHLQGSLPAGSDPWHDTVTLPNPALAFAARLHHALRTEGIRIDHPPRLEPGAADRLPPSTPRQPRPTPISLPSRPLHERVRQMLKPSQNLYAQLLLLEAGSALDPLDSLETSEDRGLRALHAFVRRIGIPAAEVQMNDGSGLSRTTLVTPGALVALLRHMDRHPARESFVEALPIAGVDGTLRARLLGTPAAGNLRAKTGSLRFVNTLSGFVTNAAGQRLVFSLMLNAYQPPPGGPSGREAIDQAAQLLATRQP